MQTVESNDHLIEAVLLLGGSAMVEGQSMTTFGDVVAQVRDGRLEDFVREAVVLVARELTEGEISAEIGAEFGEVSPNA